MPTPKTNWIRRVLAHGATWRWLLGTYWLVLLVATHLPTSFPALPPEGVDKLIHFGAYAIFAFLLAMAWQASAGKLNKYHLWVVWLALCIYAAFDELTQIPVGRHASFEDWLADAVGAAVGLAVFLLWQRARRQETQHSTRAAEDVPPQ